MQCIAAGPSQVGWSAAGARGPARPPARPTPPPALQHGWVRRSCAAPWGAPGRCRGPACGGHARLQYRAQLAQLPGPARAGAARGCCTGRPTGGAPVRVAKRRINRRRWPSQLCTPPRPARAAAIGLCCTSPTAAAPTPTGSESHRRRPLAQLRTRAKAPMSQAAAGAAPPRPSPSAGARLREPHGRGGVVRETGRHRGSGGGGGGRACGCGDEAFQGRRDRHHGQKLRLLDVRGGTVRGRSGARFGSGHPTSAQAARPREQPPARGPAGGAGWTPPSNARRGSAAPP